MRVFVSEHLTCGAMHDEPELPASLLNEGRAMHAAIVTDCAQLDGVDVVTTWDDRLPLPQVPGNVIVHRTDSADSERDLFFELVRQADATLVIAPEFQNCLLDRWQMVAEAGGHWLGCDADAIAICSDKLRMSQVLASHGLPVVSTVFIAPEQLPPWSWPVVVKPRDGAGSVNVQQITSLSEWHEMLRRRDACEFCPPDLVQPFVTGNAISVAAIVSDAGQVNVLPTATQELTTDGHFIYSGGTVPGLTDHDPINFAELVGQIRNAIPGLRGYFGVDLIVGDDGVTIIEINPRLTTSYLGYRRLTPKNLAGCMLGKPVLSPMAWNREQVRFTPSEL
ncbi:ATP-grasp domain-containing protein [Thalassoroseus pseudoceratinae]|uniref:ATP-grasp domain-containing protein n=1 Tax=Thalassoroseus pseudoceratinae TaxID=2713176 RepID=UPI001424842E|nr:ATP-grasp domain-containing protein [Thalassoroseus pseudoceratinae]